ncbi:methyltransferase domain-containing protein [Streptomyces lycii]|uniref:Protein-L-isoaspartate O-methyltransferase n=1 Tax=Streptomyces lycii TaxID=2654337 RepID=A0ABQ7FPV8_9ACTN|nr:methyltransferase domain-containing protein [Streptomyces lycii]KAF4410967.1 methyltransferase domain-containing protein [Streptomyces lycii]
MTQQHSAEEAGRARLASALLEKGSLGSDWLPSFEAVPRHLFVPDTAWPGNAGGNRQQDRVIRTEEPDAWWAAVHSDVPITTQWDDGAYTGPGRGKVPSSSNSMPSMVFSMLGALGVEDGHRVLEIGTGTGWNAALLAHRLGGGNVVTVEVDPAVSAAARARLEAAAARTGAAVPVTVVGDGADGHPPLAPYDRIIATCSVGRIPPQWLAQCRPGAVIVAPWGPVYGGEGVVRLTVGEDGTAAGPFIRSSAFMRLRDQRTDRPPFGAYLKEPWPAGGTRSTTTLSPDGVGGWIDMFVIGVRVPRMFCRTDSHGDGSYTLWLYDTDVTSWATADHEPGRTDYEVVQSGPRALWDELETAWRWWEARGKPGFERFELAVSAEGEQRIGLGEESWAVGP